MIDYLRRGWGHYNRLLLNKINNEGRSHSIVAHEHWKVNNMLQALSLFSEEEITVSALGEPIAFSK